MSQMDAELDEADVETASLAAGILEDPDVDLQEAGVGCCGRIDSRSASWLPN